MNMDVNLRFFLNSVPVRESTAASGTADAISASNHGCCQDWWEIPDAKGLHVDIGTLSGDLWPIETEGSDDDCMAEASISGVQNGSKSAESRVGEKAMPLKSSPEIDRPRETPCASSRRAGLGFRPDQSAQRKHAFRPSKLERPRQLLPGALRPKLSSNSAPVSKSDTSLSPADSANAAHESLISILDAEIARWRSARATRLDRPKPGRVPVR